MIVLLLLVQAAVHHDLPCNCIEGNIRNSCLYRRRYCALSYWYGKTKDGKSWLAGESGCATGCSKISVPGVDGGPDICLTPLQRKGLTPMSQNGFGRSENVIFSLTDFVGTACDGEAAVAQATTSPPAATAAAPASHVGAKGASETGTAFDRALRWCEVPALARALNFSTVSPPLHFLPGRTHTHFMHRALAHMELRRGTCDLLSKEQHGNTTITGCDRIEGGSRDSPDAWLLDTMEVILSDCNRSAVTCNTIDIGSNLGLISLRMLQSGARLTAVEPQTDLCCASRASAQYNGFGQRSRFICAGAGVSDSVSEGDVLSVKSNAYRYGGGTRDLSQMYTRLGLPRSVPLVKLSSILGARGTHYRFIKIDTDSVDCDLLRELLNRQRKGLLSFESVSLEVWTGSHCEGLKFAQLLAELQQDGYDLYRTPASSAEDAVANTYEFQETQDNFPELTQNVVRLQTTSLLRFKVFTVAEWLAVPGQWKKQYQLLVTKAKALSKAKASDKPAVWPSSLKKGHRAKRSRRQGGAQRGAAIPPLLHYVLTGRGSQRFDWSAYVSFRAAKDRIRPRKIIVHILDGIEPPGQWWAAARAIPGVEVRRFGFRGKDDHHGDLINVPRELNGVRVAHPAHVADLKRFAALWDEGGYYFDTDHIAIRDFAPLAGGAYSSVWGRQVNQVTAVGAFLTVPRNPLIRVMRAAMYRRFDGSWSKHSTFMVNDVLSSLRKGSVHTQPLEWLPNDTLVLPYPQMFPFGWQRFLFSSSQRSLMRGKGFDWDAPRPIYSVHLFHAAQKAVLRNFSCDDLKRNNTNIAVALHMAVDNVGDLCTKLNTFAPF